MHLSMFTLQPSSVSAMSLPSTGIATALGAPRGGVYVAGERERAGVPTAGVRAGSAGAGMNEQRGTSRTTGVSRNGIPRNGIPTTAGGHRRCLATPSKPVSQRLRANP